MKAKSKGFFRKKKIAGKEYIIKVKNKRDGDNVKQEFLFHVGSLEELRKVVCSD